MPRTSWWPRSRSAPRSAATAPNDLKIPRMRTSGWLCRLKAALFISVSAADAPLIDIDCTCDNQTDGDHLVVGGHVDEIESIRQDAHRQHAKECLEDTPAAAPEGGPTDHCSRDGFELHSLP